jgi:c-di-AMP phosphodiesterase-like protein
MILDLNSDNPKIIIFDWGHKINKLDSLGFKTDIYEILIQDNNGNNHIIYKNTDYDDFYKKN